MRCRSWSRLALIALVVCLWQSCGSDGDGGNDEAPSDVDDQQPPGSVDPIGLTEVKGRVLLGADGGAASGYQIWKIDHGADSFARILLDSAGQFSWPLTAFKSGHHYSFYIANSELQGFGSIDFAPATAGTQSSVLYSGGLGFDMGDMEVAVAANGKPDAAGTALAVELGGGFSLDDTTTLTIEDLSLPTGLTSVAMGRDLLVLDPLAVLYGIYRREDNPALYAEALLEASRLRFAASYRADQIVNVFVGDAGPWLSSARLAENSGANKASSPLWSLSSYMLPDVKDGTRVAFVYPPDVLPAETIAFLKVWSAAGEAVDVPVLLSSDYALPPLISGVSTDGESSPTSIDYAADGPNGATVPLCFEDEDVVLQVSPPQDHAGELVTGETHSSIDVEIEYFGAAGPIASSAAAFADAFQEEFEDSELPAYQRTWQPSTATIRFVMDEAVYEAATHDLSIWRDLFLAKVGDETITKVRLKVFFVSSNEVDRAGIVIWFNRDC